MRIYLGDTIILVDPPRRVGIVERRQGDHLMVRFPDDGNKRQQVARTRVRALAEVLYEARTRGTKYKNHLSLTGGSTLADLVVEFGYATQRLRSESLNKVLRQLQRAGLEVHSETDRWSRDDKFKLTLATNVSPESPEPGDQTAPSPQLLPVTLPDVFWPTALGLDRNRELAFLRALTATDPILCLLYVPDATEMHGWLQPTWEGLISWAFHTAQRFRRRANADSLLPEVRIAPSTLLQTYLETSVLSFDAPRLLDRPYALNLISLQQESDAPVDLLRIRAVWPGPVFDFKPEPSKSPEGQLSEDVRALLECLLLIAGSPTEVQDPLSPLQTLLWSKEACTQILARASIHLGELFASGELSKFKGSNENATALALKADLAQWVKRADAEAVLHFEVDESQGVNEYGEVMNVQRVDLLVEGQGRFEVETLVGSGPMEAFYHQKVFTRVAEDRAPLWLVVPNDAVLWAGPYLGDLAHHLGASGSVLIPGLGAAYLKVHGRPLGAQDIDVPWDDLRQTSVRSLGKAGVEEPPLRLKDVAGYKEIRERVEELIIWPEKHRRALRRPSRASGILFFGPPGCGKPRLARAIAGELEQEVRLLSPSDLRGAYVGWGQIKIREQFDWVAAQERRMLVIDEIDAVARSRYDIGNMHSDEKADVNELLVQLDRASRLGRLVVGTTNYVKSLDDAVVRSGRFGRFIPVAPPDIDEAMDILAYYLKSLTGQSELDNQMHVQVPEAIHLRSTLEPLFAENAREHRFFCGADLEEAVNRTYQRCLRQMLGDAWPEDYARVHVNLTPAELTRSLNDVARSVTEDAFAQFIEDVKRFCGSTIANQICKRFNVEV